jgi:hypothetical protein
VRAGQEDHQDEEEATGLTAPRPARHRKGNTPAMAAVLASGGSQQEAAEAGGISVREVRRRQHEPGVRKIIREYDRERRRQAAATIAEGFLEAIDTIRDLQAPEQAPELRLKAAKEMISAAFRNLESLEVDERLDELETKVRADLDPDLDS